MSNKKLNLIGRRFGRLTVISDAGVRISEKGRKSYLWNCICDCGETTVVTTSNLQGNKVLSCGCYRNERVFETNSAKLQNQTFGRLTAISCIHKNGVLYWKCRCSCGNYVEVIPASLTSGKTRSCGCYQKERARQTLFKHGFSKKGPESTRLYRIWGAMKYRCYNPKSNCYNRYGGRGITVCDEWKDDFTCFYEWAIKNGYNDSLSIERKDYNGNYCPDNCCWANWKQQAINRSSTRFIEYKGKQMSIKDLAIELNINYDTLISRINNGWSIEKMINTPVKKNGGHSENKRS